MKRFFILAMLIFAGCAGYQSDRAESPTGLGSDPFTERGTFSHTNANAMNNAINDNSTQNTANAASITALTNGTTPAGVATTVTITDNEDTDEENPIVFVAGADPDGGNLGLETDGDCTYNPLYGLITCTAFGGDGSGLTGITSSTALDDLTDPDASKTVDINAFTFRLQVDASGAIIIGDYASGDYMKWNQTYAEFVGDYYLQGSQNLSAVDADGEYGGITDVYTVDSGAAASLFGQAMHIDTDGELICADDDAAATLPFAGALVTAGTGANKALLVSGKFCEADMNWTVGGDVYASGDPSTTLGYTQTVPTTNFGQKVGVAVTADCIQLDVGPVVGF